MSTPTYTVSADDTLARAHQIMLDRSVSCLAVIQGPTPGSPTPGSPTPGSPTPGSPTTGDAGQLVGIITRSDLLRVGTAMERDRWSRALELPEQRVHEAMSQSALAVGIDASVQEAAALMVERHVHRVFVTARGDVTGVLSTQDVMRGVADLADERPLSAFMSSPVLTIDSHMQISHAVAALERSGVHGLVVVERDRAVGVFADIDALEARDWPPEHPVEQVMNTRILCMEHDTPLRRAAEQAAALRARRVLCTRAGQLVGVLTGIDFARSLIVAAD